MNTASVTMTGKSIEHRWNPAGVRSFIAFLVVAGLVSVGSVVAQYRLIAAQRANVVGDGRNVDSYGFDLSNFTLNRDVLVASGQPKGGLPALTRPEFADRAGIDDRNDPPLGSWQRFIVSTDMVVGVAINGEARAYPVRIMNWHEVVNDTVGGVPITVVFHSITKTAAVFERTMGDEVLEFGFSGLLHNSSPVLFDKREEAAGESLWSPITGKPIAGPAVERGDALVMLPCQFTRWDAWRAAHPESTAIVGEKRFKKRYRRLPFSDEFRSGEPQFPVEPLVAADHPAGLHYWDTVAAVREPGGGWSMRGDALKIDGLLPSDQPTLFTSWFVWYAYFGDEGIGDDSTELSNRSNNAATLQSTNADK